MDAIFDNLSPNEGNFQAAAEILRGTWASTAPEFKETTILEILDGNIVVAECTLEEFFRDNEDGLGEGEREEIRESLRVNKKATAGMGFKIEIK
jgi:hypothetical protein